MGGEIPLFLPLPIGGGAGGIHHRRAGQTVVGEQYLPRLLCHLFTVQTQAQGSVHTDALYRPHKVGGGAQLHDGGEQRRLAASVVGEQTIALSRAAQSGGRRATHRDQHVGGGIRLAVGDDRPAVFRLLNGIRFSLAQDGHTLRLGGETQGVQHRPRLLRGRVYFAVGAGDTVHTDGGEEIQCLRDCKRFQNTARQGRSAVITGGIRVDIGQVAGAVAGGHQLLAHTGILLQHQHTGRRLFAGEEYRRRQTRGTAADYDCIVGHINLSLPTTSGRHE